MGQSQESTVAHDTETGMCWSVTRIPAPCDRRHMIRFGLSATIARL